MNCHALAVAILLCALALYAMGMSGGGALLLAGGAAMELWFWARALRGGRQAATPGKRP